MQMKKSTRGAFVTERGRGARACAFALRHLSSVSHAPRVVMYVKRRV